MKLKVKLLASALTIATLFATSAFAASASFNGTLPANQGDTQISTVSRANNQNVVKYFSITVYGMASGYSAVRAWAESSLGVNSSSPYNQVPLGVSKTVSYDYVPLKGSKVVLNLDNPVSTSSKVEVAGTWSPN